MKLSSVHITCCLYVNKHYSKPHSHTYNVLYTYNILHCIYKIIISVYIVIII